MNRSNRRKIKNQEELEEEQEHWEEEQQEEQQEVDCELWNLKDAGSRHRSRKKMKGFCRPQVGE